MHGEIIKVTVVSGGTNQPTVRRELTGAELEEWKEKNGYGNHTTDSVEPDPEREAPSASDQSE